MQFDLPKNLTSYMNAPYVNALSVWKQFFRGLFLPHPFLSTNFPMNFSSGGLLVFLITLVTAGFLSEEKLFDIFHD